MAWNSEHESENESVSNIGLNKCSYFEVVIVFRERNIETVLLGSECIMTVWPKIWDLILAEIKASKSLNIFKTKDKEMSSRELPMSHLQDLLVKLVS